MMQTFGSRADLRSSHFGNVHVVPSSAVGLDDELVPAAGVLFALDDWLSNPASRRALAVFSAHPTDASRTRRSLEDAFRRGHLCAVVVRARPVVVEAPVRVEPLGPTPREPTFIEISLIDPNGDPVAGERYRITLESGEVREGKLDRAGLVRLEGIEGEEFTLDLPDRKVA